MASCDPLKFRGVSANIFNNIATELTQKGFVIAGAAGTVKGPFGIVIEYRWDEPQELLVIEIADKSFFVSCDQIRDQLTDSLGKYLPAV
ncbi:MAG: hypothetical protein ACOYXT_04605 [Bacteroidota bacterium]